jgi:ankyrin repeat protein
LAIVPTLPSKLINHADDKGRTALHFASAGGHLSIVKCLLKHAADPNMTDFNGSSPLHLAVIGNHLAIVGELLQAGAQVRASDRFHRTPLDMAQSRLNMLRGVRFNAEFLSQLLELVQMLKSYAMTVATAGEKSPPLETIPEELDSLTSQLHQTRIAGSDKQEEALLISDAQLDQLQVLLNRIKLL